MRKLFVICILLLTGFNVFPQNLPSDRMKVYADFYELSIAYQNWYCNRSVSDEWGFLSRAEKRKYNNSFPEYSQEMVTRIRKAIEKSKSDFATKVNTDSNFKYEIKSLLEQLNKGEDAILDWWRLLYENGYPLEEYHTTERMAYNQEFLMNSCMFLDQEFPGNDITDSVIEKVKLGMKEHRAGNYSFLQEDYMEDYMMLKYPVLLVHGAGFRDKTLGFVNYWGRIPKSFAKNGVTVYYGGTDAWGSIEGNAEIIKNSIEAILAETNAEKVNIIAHSRGGLESRYLISTLNMGHAVASLTTISTPHHGVKAMNIAMELPVGLYKFCSFFVNTWFRILGDKKPNFFESSRQLSEKCSIAFNENNPDKEGIYYQSYAGMMQYFFSDLTFIAMHPFIFFADGANDGLCPVESAKWGDFKGIITTEGAFGISHCGVIDLYRVNYKGLNILDFYLSIAQGLSEKGL